MKLRIVKDPAVRRTEILDSAYALFTRQGYERTSISQIIGAVGLSKGAFYHHFASKEELLEALAGRIAATVAAEAQSILEDPSLDAFARLTAFLAHLRKRKTEQVGELKEMFEPVFRAENVRLFHCTHAATTAVIQPILARIIAEGVEERTFDTADPQTAAALIVQLGATGRDLVAEAFTSTGIRQREAALDKVMERLDYLGTVVDRILGIPEGSVCLVTRNELETMIVAMQPKASAAA
jgi:AcrR family transcriptional regulator